MNYLDLLQSINNILYSILGSGDLVINLQVYINGKRFETNTVDLSEVITMDGDLKLVQ